MYGWVLKPFQSFAEHFRHFPILFIRKKETFLAIVFSKEAICRLTIPQIRQQIRYQICSRGSKKPVDQNLSIEPNDRFFVENGELIYQANILSANLLHH